MKKLNEISGMPQMRAAFSGWQQPITLDRIVAQTIVDGFLQKTTDSITFSGTIQPLQPQQIQIKPEGERAFVWWQIHCVGNVDILNVNDIIIIDRVEYKVMAKKDYSRSNYYEYHIIEKYQP